MAVHRGVLSVTSQRPPAVVGRHRRPGTPGTRAGRAVTVAALALLLAAGVAAAAGVRWLAVATPSMGTAAPVGSLVVTVPARTAGLHVGDVVAVHEDGLPGGTLVHRVVGRSATSAVTRGDLNGAADPTVVTDARLVGRAVVVVPALGYVVRGLPRGVGGILLVLALTRWWVPRPLRTSLRVLGICVVHAALVLMLHPFLGVTTTATATTPDGVAHVSVVSTGLLPTRVSATVAGSRAAPVLSPDLAAGERTELTVPGAGGSGRVLLRPHAALPWWGWTLLWTLCLAPLLVVRPLRPARPAGGDRA